MSWLKDLGNSIRNGDGLVRLLIVNTIVFLVIQFFLLFSRFAGSDLPARIGDDLYMASTSNLHWLLLRPWSVITHMFAHTEFSHFLFNMVFLYTAGKLFRLVLDSRKLVVVYLLGGISGYALFLGLLFLF